MYIIKGSKKEELSKEKLIELIDKHNGTIVDLGTGDGRFVFKQAVENLNHLYIGIDPSEKQLEIYSKEANKKRLTNLLLILGSIELLPEELKGIADYMYINLPWGSLLENIVNPTKDNVITIADVLKANGTLEIILGYHDEAEPGETKRLSLPKLEEELIKEVIYPAFGGFGKLELVTYKVLSKEELKELDTSWAKKLSFGSDRPIYKLIFTKEA